MEPIHSQEIQEFKENAPAKMSEIRILNGHNTYGLHKYFSGDIEYITILREPTARFISGYHHLRRVDSKEDVRNNFLDDLDGIEDFIKKGEYDFGNNAMVKRFIKYESKVFLMNDELLEEAKANLKNEFKVVGLTEKFDESLVLLNKNMGWNITHYAAKNVAKDYKKKSIDKSLYDLFKKYNPYDVAFYEYAVELFNKQIESLGPDFEKEVEAFKINNSQYKEPSKSKWKASINTFINFIRPK